MQDNELAVTMPQATPRRAWSGALIRRLMLWHHRHRTRLHLGALDDRLLADIGLSRVAAEREVARHFWC